MSNIQQYFVSVGRPESGTVVANRVKVDVDLEKITPIKAAKNVRKMISQETSHPSKDEMIKQPSLLFWAVYDTADSGYPFLYSKNTPTQIQKKVEENATRKPRKVKSTAG